MVACILWKRRKSRYRNCIEFVLPCCSFARICWTFARISTGASISMSLSSHLDVASFSNRLYAILEMVASTFDALCLHISLFSKKSTIFSVFWALAHLPEFLLLKFESNYLSYYTIFSDHLFLYHFSFMYSTCACMKHEQITMCPIIQEIVRFPHTFVVWTSFEEFYLLHC